MTTQKTQKALNVSEAQKRSVACPECGVRAGKPCKSSRIPGPNTFGGGWGGPPDLDRAHAARRTSYLTAMAAGASEDDLYRHRMEDEAAEQEARDERRLGDGTRGEEAS